MFGVNTTSPALEVLSCQLLPNLVPLNLRGPNWPIWARLEIPEDLVVLSFDHEKRISVG